MLRQRRRRARALGPATFLIDRVAGDLADRQQLGIEWDFCQDISC